MIIVQLNGSITDPKNVGSTHPCGEHVVWTFWSCFLRTISERNEVYPVDSYLKRTDPPPPSTPIAGGSQIYFDEVGFYHKNGVFITNQPSELNLAHQQWGIVHNHTCRCKIRKHVVRTLLICFVLLDSEPRTGGRN